MTVSRVEKTDEPASHKSPVKYSTFWSGGPVTTALRDVEAADVLFILEVLKMKRSL